MTYRERKEARLEKRLAWAESRDRKSAAGYERARVIADGIPMGQPILVGHHSEKRHRRDLARIDSGMRESVDSAKMAATHRSTAAEIEHQLDRSIYSDDPDAPERLREKLDGLEALREEKRKLGAAWRKAKKPSSADIEGWKRVCLILGWDPDGQKCISARSDTRSEEGFLNRGPVPAYVLSNLGGRITTGRKRLQELERVKVEGQPWRYYHASKYESTCVECGQKIEKGSAILYRRGEGEAKHYPACKTEGGPS